MLAILGGCGFFSTAAQPNHNYELRDALVMGCLPGEGLGGGTGESRAMATLHHPCRSNPTVIRVPAAAALLAASERSLTAASGYAFGEDSSGVLGPGSWMERRVPGPQPAVAADVARRVLSKIAQNASTGALSSINDLHSLLGDQRALVVTSVSRSPSVRAALAYTAAVVLATEADFEAHCESVGDCGGAS